jgi:hypothetical protein
MESSLAGKVALVAGATRGARDRGVADSWLAPVGGHARGLRGHRVELARRDGALARDPEVSRWTGKSLSSGQLAKVYGFTDLDGSQPDAWRYVAEVQDAGRPADTTGYR